MLTSERPRLDFLDGLRGLTALYVVCFHELLYERALPGWAQGGLALFRHGHLAVCVFIVLSGFCLMLPVACSLDGHIPGGMAGFFARRARRILPPYYAALAASLVLGALTKLLLHHLGVAANPWYSNLEPGLILSHIFLVHNLSLTWAFGINSPLWSVATEWQIYFLFPCLLLPLWRRAGIAGLLAVAFTFGLAPHFLMPAAWNIDTACPWFLGLFALGAVGALACFREPALSANRRQMICWGGMGVACTALLSAFLHLEAQQPYITDTLMGGVTLALLVCITRGRDVVTPSVLQRLLEWRPLLRLGTFSYSLYLVHRLVQDVFMAALSHLHISPLLRLGLHISVGIPLSVAAGYIFYWCVERPFVSARQKRRIVSHSQEVRPACVTVTAPPL